MKKIIKYVILDILKNQNRYRLCVTVIGDVVSVFSTWKPILQKAF